jgi:hypothetical protein
MDGVGEDDGADQPEQGLKVRGGRAPLLEGLTEGGTLGGRNDGSELALQLGPRPGAARRRRLEPGIPHSSGRGGRATARRRRQRPSYLSVLPAPDVLPARPNRISGFEGRRVTETSIIWPRGRAWLERRGPLEQGPPSSACPARRAAAALPCSAGRSGHRGRRTPRRAWDPAVGARARPVEDRRSSGAVRRGRGAAGCQHCFRIRCWTTGSVRIMSANSRSDHFFAGLSRRRGRPPGLPIARTFCCGISPTYHASRVALFLRCSPASTACD